MKSRDRTQTQNQPPSPFEGLGPALAALRRRAGLSRRQIGERAGLKPPSLHRYETGKGLPKLATLDAILSALGCDALDLALELHRRQAEARAEQARPSLERPDLLARPEGRQILHQARMLYHLGSFWTDAALALLPAARPAAASAEDQAGAGEPASRGAEEPDEADDAARAG